MYYKKTHKAWYVNRGSKCIRLGVTREEAEVAWQRLHTCEELSDLASRFLTHHIAQSTAGTVQFYRRPLESFLRSTTCVKIADLRPHHVLSWLSADSGPTYRHNQMRAIKTCLAWGVKVGLIDRSPLQHMELPPAISRGDEAYLMPNQWASIERIVKGNLLDLLLVLKHTGCRPQEVRHAEARHLQGNCLIFPKHESKGKIVSRVIQLDQVARGICQKLALKYPVGRLFRNDYGNPWTAKLLDKRCATISRRVGFPFTPYSLRHTFATEAIVRGVDLQTIATLMGHKDLKMLSKVYQHVQRRSEHLQESLNRITA
jgi:integrase